MMNTRLGICAAAILLAACTSSNSTNASAEGKTYPEGSPEAIALQVIAEQTGITANEITVVMAQEMDFSDSSLGCPEPGMSYLQVITRGYRVVVNYEGLQYDVRIANGNGTICKNRKPVKTQQR